MNRLLYSLTIVAMGATADLTPARAQSLTVTDPFLYYANYGPNNLGGGSAGGQNIAYGADSVVPNGNNGTVGGAFVTNPNTGMSEFISYINFNPGPIDPNLFFEQIPLSSVPAGPWTLEFVNNGTTPNHVVSNLSLVGPGELPLAQSVTLSGTGANPTFSWSAPPGVVADGYRVQIFQNNLVGPGNNGAVAAANLTQPTFTVQASDFTIPGYSLKPNTEYTIETEILQTKNGSTTDLSNGNLSAASRVFSNFEILPNGAPPVNLPTTTVSGKGVVYGFNLTVEPGLTYYLDQEVATGYVFQTGSGNPNFASVELPDIGNPTPYNLYSWNGSSFVFDTMLVAGTVYDFTGGGVSEFEVLGIDPSLGLNPANTTAFITGLTFVGDGYFTGTMTPITTSVPEPSTWALMLVGFGGFGFIGYRKAKKGRATLEAA
jgi:hypothetical protein